MIYHFVIDNDIVAECDYCGDALYCGPRYNPEELRDFAAKKGWAIEEDACMCKTCHEILSKPSAMISQPMGGKGDEEIRDVRSRAGEYLEEQGYRVWNTLFEDYRDSCERVSAYRPYPCNIALRYLAKSIKAMAFCKAVYFCKGWEDARGCVIEHEAAKRYGLTIIYEHEPNRGKSR